MINSDDIQIIYFCLIIMKRMALWNTKITKNNCMSNLSCSMPTFIKICCRMTYIIHYETARITVKNDWCPLFWILVLFILYPLSHKIYRPCDEVVNCFSMPYDSVIFGSLIKCIRKIKALQTCLNTYQNWNGKQICSLKLLLMNLMDI